MQFLNLYIVPIDEKYYSDAIAIVPIMGYMKSRYIVIFSVKNSKALQMGVKREGIDCVKDAALLLEDELK